MVAKAEIARFVQFLLLSLCFQKAFCCRGVRKRLYEGKGLRDEPFPRTEEFWRLWIKRLLKSRRQKEKLLKFQLINSIIKLLFLYIIYIFVLMCSKNVCCIFAVCVKGLNLIIIVVVLRACASRVAYCSHIAGPYHHSVGSDVYSVCDWMTLVSSVQWRPVAWDQ